MANLADKILQLLHSSFFLLFFFLSWQPRKGELVYAELADFGNTNNDIETRKPEHHETTMYADVVTSDVYRKANADASDPAYANVQSVK